MEVIYLNGQQVNITEPVCVALGFFDGLHRGHMALVNKVIEVAQQKGYKKALMTFDHHPLFVLGQLKEEKYLTSMKDRIHILEDKNIDYLFIIQFTKDVAAISPQDFINHYLLACHVCHVVCGFDYRFAHKNEGNIETLKSCPSLDVSVVDKVIYQNEKISSTRIRHTLQNGCIDEMNDLLGRRYCIKGRVIHGRHIGHSIGFPTANVDYESYFLPTNGVYVVKVYINGKDYMGMCNIGYNPTFHALDKKSLEIYILEFDDDIYDQDIEVEFYRLIRLEKTFHLKEELILQLTTDEQYVREYFKAQG